MWHVAYAVVSTSTAVVTAIVGQPYRSAFLEDLILKGGVDMSHCKWVPFDGLGKALPQRLKLYRSRFCPQRRIGCSDRGHTAVSPTPAWDIDPEQLFGVEGARWFHWWYFCSAFARNP